MGLGGGMNSDIDTNSNKTTKSVEDRLASIEDKLDKIMRHLKI